MLTVVGVALLLYYLFKQKPKWFTALYQEGGEATPTSADDYGGVGGGSTFTPTGTDGTGDLIPDPNSDQGSDGGGVMESFDRRPMPNFYDPEYDNKPYEKPVGLTVEAPIGRPQTSPRNPKRNSKPTVSLAPRSGSRTIAPVSVLR